MASRMNMKQFDRMLTRKILRMTTHTHRYRYRSATTAAAIAVALGPDVLTTIPLMRAIDDPNYDIGGDGITACEVETGSRIVSINLRMIFAAFTINTRSEWMLYKDPDAILGTVAPNLLFQNDLSATNALVRKHAMKYGAVYLTTERDVINASARVSRKAMGRNRRLKDLDQLTLVISNAGAATGRFSIWGTITTSK